MKKKEKLKPFMKDCIEVGVDEVGRGCLAGPVVTAAVILPKDFDNELIKDSKKLNEKQLEKAYQIITEEALAWTVSQNSPEMIDKHNILNATMMSMCDAIESLDIVPEHIIVDGNQFKNYFFNPKFKSIPVTTVIKGDATYYSIAAASIIAKYTRDKMMSTLALSFPNYGWESNVGYATQKHRDAIKKHGVTEWHRKSFIGNILMEMNSKPLF